MNVFSEVIIDDHSIQVSAPPFSKSCQVPESPRVTLSRPSAPILAAVAMTEDDGTLL